jgi:hypothetical protein
MKTNLIIYMSILLGYGIFGIVSNLFHFSKGSKIKIGESAKKQHREIPLDLDPEQFYYKAVLMFITGILFTLSSLTYFLYDTKTGIEFTLINSIIHSGYGLIQLIIYYRFYRVWGAFVVYSIPLILYFITC